MSAASHPRKDRRSRTCPLVAPCTASCTELGILLIVAPLVIEAVPATDTLWLLDKFPDASVSFSAAPPLIDRALLPVEHTSIPHDLSVTVAPLLMVTPGLALPVSCNAQAAADPPSPRPARTQLNAPEYRRLTRGRVCGC